VSAAAETPAVLATRALVARRGPRDVLHDVTFALQAGEPAALVGPNAAGKSTLLRVLAGLLPAAGGEVSLLGRKLPSWDRDARARTVALVAPDEDAPPLLTVEERVRLGRFPHRGPFRPWAAGDRAAVERALERTGTLGLRGRRLATLSAGERQLAALARGLAQEPRLLLLDEPGAHLDVGHQLQLFRVLDEVCAEGVAVLAVVHDLQRAADWARRMLLLADGRLAADGPAAEVLESEPCARAFGVAIRPHLIAGLPRALYSFEAPR
jgi:ABC-type cobalamin/Fe3+-siderophores transport system ATPase subunit